MPTSGSRPLKYRERLRRLRPAELHPSQLVVISFGFVIAIGTLLLSLPVASADGRPKPLVDAFFTAASATCVTGLTVVDTGTSFSLFGQLVILSCIQVGGLGLMTLTTLFAVAMGKRMTIADRIAIRDSFLQSRSNKLRSLVGYIVSATLVTEGLGAAVLTVYWLKSGTFGSVSETIYQAVFHSVSAFCNAGFSLFSDNLVRFRSDWFVLLTLSLLIIAGGLGYLVSLDVFGFVRERFRKSPVRDNAEFAPPRHRISLHSRFVLSITAALLLIGLLSYYLLERNGLFAGMTPSEALLNSWFCSVTARTAGFNTIDYGAMSASGLLCTMVLMFIGASPGSTGGGIKTSTFGLLLTYGLFRWRGHAAPHAFGRSFPNETIDRATSVVIASVAVVIVASSVLMAAETSRPDAAESQRRFLPVLFETFSAFGTVGLSMNHTAGLTTAAKIILAAVMFIGRVGPLTMAIGLAARGRRPEIRYAEENVMVG